MNGVEALQALSSLCRVALIVIYVYSQYVLVKSNACISKREKEETNKGTNKQRKNGTSTVDLNSECSNAAMAMLFTLTLSYVIHDLFETNKRLLF